MSFRMFDIQEAKPIGDRALAYAARKGVVLVAAAGNEGSPRPPAPFPDPNPLVINVAATTPAGNKAGFSNWGPWVEIGAPGTAIYSTIRDGYASYQGTSMASPVVAGVVGLLFESGRCTTSSCATQRLFVGATRNPSLARYWPGGLVVNACRAVAPSFQHCN
ncbi:MAG: S8 family serine peptidase, partial [Dehalococcoidia bacterium]|nr:S8 family serine peptidase [Dehalococcoidia bacterium]